MQNRRDIVVWEEDFNGGQALSATQGAGRLTVKDTSAAGTPTYALNALCSSGEAVLTMDNTNEVQDVALYFGDILPVTHANLRWFECRVKLSGTLSAVQTFHAGMTGAHNATWTSAVGAMFGITGDASSNILICRTLHSGLTVSQATTMVLSTTYLTLGIDFTDKRDIKFYAGQIGALQRLLPIPTAAFNLSGATQTAGLQPNVGFYKASGTGTPALTIDYMAYEAIRL